MKFTFTKFSGFMAASVWTLGWLRIAHLAVEHLMAFDSNGARLNVFISILGIGFGSAMAFGFYPRNRKHDPAKPTPPEPWYRRATGWFGATVWCVFGAIWNMAIYRVLIQSATKGQTANFLILIPFALIGLFLLLFLFVGVTLVLDSLFRLEDEASPPAAVPPVLETPQPQPPPPAPSISDKPIERAAPPASSGGLSFKGKPVLGALLFLVFINWFVFFGISLYLGGDAVGVLPSHDGFVLKSHGNHTVVPESTWVFSLCYSTATLLGTPAIFMPIVLWQSRGKWSRTKWPMRLGICLFVLIWTTGWFGGIGSSFFRSYNDWQKLKQQAAPPSFPSPDTRTNVNR